MDRKGEEGGCPKSSGMRNPSRNGAPGAIPTRDLPLRRRTLYATELRELEKQEYSKQ